MDSDSGLSELSSELSSVRSVSPPPHDYPSPQSTQEIGGNFSSNQNELRKRPRESDDLPPAKKRKSVEAKPRTTVHLDLQSASPAVDQSSQLALLLKVLRKRRKIVVIAGAGISTAAGVPDFRSSSGLFNTLRSDNKLKASGKHLFDASVYQTDDSTSSFHDMVRTLSQIVSDARPTIFHEMLATLASESRLMRLYTQNVDGIDTSLTPLRTKVPLENKGPWPQTIQLHGSLEKMVCTKCNKLSPFEAALFSGPVPPLCTQCVENDQIRTDVAGKRSHGIGRLRPRMVLYNESNPDDEAIGAVVKADLLKRPDAVIVVGTSMEIPGVKRMVREMCGIVRDRRDGVAIWINRGPPPIGKEFEDCWDLVVAGDCDQVAQRANMRRWNDEGNDYKDCTESEAERAKEKDSGIKVLVNPARRTSVTPKRAVSPKHGTTPAMMTPGESPMSKATKLPKAFIIPPLILSDTKEHSKTKSLVKGAGKKNGVKNTSISKTTVSKISKTSDNSKINFKIIKPQKPLANSAKPTPLTNAPRPPSKERTPKFLKPRPSPTNQEKAKKLLASINEPFDDTAIPMMPISPQSARNNGPMSPAKTLAEGVKLEKVEIPVKLGTPPEVDEIQDSRKLKRMSEERISPTGNVPSGMAQLLHF
ncbi:MAG: hypothetical protein Q9175_002728 [Cornicularia normoerica]